MKTSISLTVGLLLLAATLVSAQQRFSIGITAAPTYAYSNTTQTVYLPAVYVPTAPVGSTDPVPVVWSGKNHAWGYVMGGTIQYNFPSNWSVSTGFWYNQTSMTNIAPLPYTITPIRTSSHSVQVPLFINYRLTSNRLSPYFSVGGLASLNQHTLAQYEPGSGQGDINFRLEKAVNYRPVLGVGIAYRLNQSLFLIAQPMVIWNFKPAGDFSHYTSYQLNGQTQLVYSF